jgi:hypothetical protein
LALEDSSFPITTTKSQIGRYQVVMEDKTMPLILDTVTGKIWVRRMVKEGQFAWLCYDLPNEFKPADREALVETDKIEGVNSMSETEDNYSAANDHNSVFYKGNK